MKTIFTFITLSLIILQSYSQNNDDEEKGFMNISEIGYGQGFGKYEFDDKNSIENNLNYYRISTINGFMFNKYFFGGGGIAVDIYDQFVYVPVFLDARAYMPLKNYSPFMYFDFGYNLCPENDAYEKGGIHFDFGVGSNFTLNEKISLNFSVGLNTNIMETTIADYDEWGNFTGMYERKNFPAKFLSFKMGLTF